MPIVNILVPDCPYDRHLWDWISQTNHSEGRKCHRCGMTVKVEVRS
jgi:hypothetical protein